MTTALVLGGATCLDSDIRTLELILDIDARDWPLGPVVAVNDAGWFWPGRLDHWATLHSEKFDDWKKRRRLRDYPDGFLTWTPSGHEGRGGRVDRVLGRILQGRVSEGSSGLVGVWVALEVADRVVLAGIPMDRQGHLPGATAEGPFLTKSREADQKKLDGFREVWQAAHSILAPRLRSVSGWTAKQFGTPTSRWMRGEE